MSMTVLCSISSFPGSFDPENIGEKLFLNIFKNIHYSRGATAAAVVELIVVVAVFVVVLRVVVRPTGDFIDPLGMYPPPMMSKMRIFTGKVTTHYFYRLTYLKSSSTTGFS